MSFQKKSLILQQLQQAIKKKAQQKSRNKDAMRQIVSLFSRVIQGSIQKKKNILKTATNKDNRIASIHKNSETASKQNLPDKPVSIFNNEHLTVFESTEFKAKKYNNRRLDKLVSLIQYMISSSEKALRYISSTNFEAEFALKLYRSDRQNLANELKNLNFEDIIDSQRYTELKGGKQDQTFNILLEENNQLKKEILILEKQAQSYHNKLKDGESAQLKHLDKQNNKLKEMLRKVIPFDNFKHILEILQKENKFQVMALKCQENSKKTTEIQIVISSLQNQRANIIDNLSKHKQRNDKHFKLSQIQAEKDQLQKELNQMKVKLSEIIDSGKSLSQLDMIKKNSELVTEKLFTLAKELSPNTQMKRNNEQLIDHIKNAVSLLQTKNNQLSQAVSRFVQQNQSLKRQLKGLVNQEKDIQSQQQDIRMTNMLSQIQKLRDVVDELDQQQQRSAEKILDLEKALKDKEKEILRLKTQLNKAVDKDQEMQQVINEARDQSKALTHKLEDKERYYIEKLARMEEINKELSNQNSEISEENQQLRSQIEEFIQRNQSREESKLHFSEKAKIDSQDLQRKLEKNRANHDRELDAKKQQIQRLYEQLSHYKTQNAEIKQSLEINNTKLAKLSKDQADLIQQLSQLQGQLERARKEHASITQKLRITQNEIISNNYSKDEMKFNQAERENIAKRLQAANSEITELKEQIKQIEEGLEDKDLMIAELEMRLDESKASSKKIEMGDIETSRQLNTLKQELEFLAKEKESREKLMQQQRQRHLSESENLSNKLHEAELLNIQLSKEKVQAKEQLEMQRENNDSLKHKIGILQDSITQLQDEIKSLTLLSSQAQGERQQSKEAISTIEQERETLKKELSNTKQQITQHLELVQFKNKQYVNLLRQILKGLELDPLDYKDLNTFEELLEFGSQQVVQIRKRQREEQSNKRKNNKKQYEGQLAGFYEPNFDECKTKLFEDYSANKPFEKKENQGVDNIKLQQFGDFQQGSHNHQITLNEPDKQEGKGLQEFDDLQSQKMNESLISNEIDKKLELQQFGDFQQSSNNNSIISKDYPKEEGMELQDFNDLQSQRMNESLISNEIDGKLQLQQLGDLEQGLKNNSIISKDDKQEGKELQDFDDLQSQRINESLMSNDIDDKLELQQLGGYLEAANNNQILSKEHHKEEVNQLQDFDDLQSQKMNESLISNDIDEKLPDDIGLHSYPKFQEEETNRLKQIQVKHQEMERSLVEEQNIYKIEENLASSLHGEQKEEDKQEQMIKSYVQADEQVKEHMIQSYTPENNSGSIKMDNYSIFFHGANIKVPEKKTQTKPQNRPYSKHTLLSIALKNEKLDLDEFEEVKSMNENESFDSSPEIPDRQLESTKQNNSQDLIQEDEVSQ